MHSTPVILDANQPPDRFYRGGQRIAEFRGDGPPLGNVPEDWVASTTCLFGESNLGLSQLPDGELLLDAIREKPLRWLGPEHVARWGSDTMLLTKLLDAGQRLPVHLHPDGRFAAEHLGRSHGKTEAWLILRGGTVHLGFRRPVSEEELTELVDTQDTDSMLDSLHALDVEVGDAVLVPAGVPHAIGSGVFLVEVQEPEDMSILLEWEGFDFGSDFNPDLGLGMDRALAATNLKQYSRAEVARLIVSGPDSFDGLPSQADPFFRAQRVAQGPIEQGFAVLVITEGKGAVSWDSGSMSVAAGTVLLLPYCVSGVALLGEIEGVWCRPPHPGF